MKNYYLSAVFLHLFAVFTNVSFGQTIAQNKSPQKSIAVVLKFTGNNSIPSQVSLYSQNVFNGKLKNIRTTTANQFHEPVHIKVFNATEQLIHEEYAQNPLKQNMESFEPSGAIQRNEVPTNSGYLNIRFGINDDVKNIKIVSSLVGKEDEKVLSTLYIAIP